MNRQSEEITLPRDRGIRTRKCYVSRLNHLPRPHMKKYFVVASIALLALVLPSWADTIFVANFSGSNIEKFTTDGVGSLFSTSGNGPGGLALDTNGNLYVSYEYSGAIDKFT